MFCDSIKVSVLACRAVIIRDHKAQKVSSAPHNTVRPALLNALALQAAEVAGAVRLRSPSPNVQAAAKIEEGLKEWDPAKDSTIEVITPDAHNAPPCRPCR
jgi:hypothetical protein